MRSIHAEALLPKLFEKVRHELRIDADAGVGDRADDVIAVGPDADRHVSPVGELDRIADEVVQDAVKRRPVRQEHVGTHLVIFLDADFKPFFSGHRRQKAGDAACLGGQIGVALLDAHSIRFQLGEIEHRIKHFEQAPPAFLDELGKFAVLIR